MVYSICYNQQSLPFCHEVVLWTIVPFQRMRYVQLIINWHQRWEIFRWIRRITWPYPHCSVKNWFSAFIQLSFVAAFRPRTNFSCCCFLRMVINIYCSRSHAFHIEGRWAIGFHGWRWAFGFRLETIARENHEMPEKRRIDCIHQCADVSDLFGTVLFVPKRFNSCKQRIEKGDVLRWVSQAGRVQFDRSISPLTTSHISSRRGMTFGNHHRRALLGWKDRPLHVRNVLEWIGSENFLWDHFHRRKCWDAWRICKFR